MDNTVPQTPNVDVSQAFTSLKNAMHADKDYSWSWHCNIAMASVDSGTTHRIGNESASRFMQMCFGVDTSKFPEYASSEANTKDEVAHSDFGKDLKRFNTMYRMRVSPTPTLQIGTPLVKRLTDLKTILQKELNEINDIIAKADVYQSGHAFAANLETGALETIYNGTFETKDQQDGARFDNAVEILTDISDLMGDLQVYCGSEQVKFGLPMDEIQNIIMQSNFSKMGADGNPIYDANDKLQKGPNYWKPEPRINALLRSLITDSTAV
jgi:hypothetical protein